MSAVEPPFLSGLRQEFERVAEADAAAGRRAPRRPPRLRQFRLSFALPVLTALTLLVAIAVVATGAVTLSVDLGGETELPASRSPEAGFDAALVDRVALLSRERTERDRIAPGINAETARTLRMTESLRIVLPPGSDPGIEKTVATWVLPTVSGDLAIATWVRGNAETYVSSEGDLAEIDQGRAVITAGDYIIGLVPDGVERVTVTTRDGEEARLPVAGNVFAAPFDGDFAGVTWEGMAGP
jgi:hypothetical protein